MNDETRNTAATQPIPAIGAIPASDAATTQTMPVVDPGAGFAAATADDAGTRVLPAVGPESDLAADDAGTRVIPVAAESPGIESTRALPVAAEPSDVEATQALPVAMETVDGEATRVIPVAAESIGDETTRMPQTTAAPSDAETRALPVAERPADGGTRALPVTGTATAEPADPDALAGSYPDPSQLLNRDPDGTPDARTPDTGTSGADGGDGAPGTAGAPGGSPVSGNPAAPGADRPPFAAPRQVPLYSTAPPVHNGPATPPNYVQVPMEPPKERPVIRKTGPSVATIVFGVLLMLCGIVAVMLAYGFPATLLPGLGADPRVVAAIGCGAFGGILVVVAVVWAVMRIIRPKRDDGRPSGRQTR